MPGGARPSRRATRAKAGTAASRTGFSTRLLDWFDAHGRHDLPWQHPRTPYRVWLSEIMLQQTQVATVIPYFERFLAALPDLRALAAADPDRVLALWSGLGYYSRARNLHRAARTCMERHGGALPTTLEDLVALPGIGRSTAAAILAQAHGQREAILDGNVKRVLARHAGVDGIVDAPATLKRLWEIADAHLPATRLADYTQALMDLGATVCVRRAPACARCPVRGDCVALAEARVEELPTRRRVRAKPHRTIAMLVVRDHDGRVLLARRPPSGIWGGLWSLPESADDPDALRECRRRIGAARGAPRRLPPITHEFTHFRLEITPLLLRAGSRNAKPGGGTAERYVHPDEFANLGLPAPVRTLLARLRDLD